MLTRRHNNFAKEHHLPVEVTEGEVGGGASRYCPA